MSITIILIIITVACSFYAWNNESVYSGWMLNPYMISSKKQYYRFVTSGFIHADYMHLFFNMLSLYFFGDLLAAKMGIVEFVLLYLSAIIVSDLPTYLKNKNSQKYNSLGASGGVSAVIFGCILYQPVGMDICIFFALCVPAFIYGILFLIYSYYMGKRSGDRINHDAHLYGALFGVVFVLLEGDGHILPNFFQEIIHWPGLF